MDTLHIGKLAATRQTWRDKTIRELFAETKSAFPSASETVLRREFRNAVQDDPSYFDAVVAYAFDACMRAYSRAKEQESREPRSAEARAHTAKMRANEAERHATAVKYLKERIVLLNQEMPNGKRARFCTLDYMWRLGGAYRKVGKMGSQKLVGQVFGENEYRSKLEGLVA